MFIIKLNLKRLVTLMMLIIVVCIANITSASVTSASAVTLPDLERSGTIKVTMREAGTGAEIPGGTMTLFRVGDIHEEDWNFSFVPSKDFSDCEPSLVNLQTPDAAQILAAYAEDREIDGTTVAVNEMGYANFEKVKPGLYLLVQKQAPEGYYPVNPFLVSVPFLEKGEYIYDVDASPKTELLNKAPKPPAPAIPDEPSGSDEPGNSGDSDDLIGSDEPGNSGESKTGDSTFVLPWIALMLICGFLIIRIALHRKDEKK